MIKIRLPIIISTLVLTGSIIFAIFIFGSELGLDNNEKVENLIALIAATTAIIGAVFVVYSYILTNRAFILSQEPSLLIQVDNPAIDKVSHTRITYTNVTNNSLSDLTFKILVYVNSEVIDISDVFRPEMNMPGRDSRQRRFPTIETLKSKNLDLTSITNSKKFIKLQISYTYTFMKEKKEILAQEYKWNSQILGWEIY